jgi:hypothetical protein
MVPLNSADGCSQTDTHIAYDGKPNMDSTYHWNEWELRRRAILLVNLRTKATHSVQTDVSRFRREQQIQCEVLGKNKDTQTVRNNATQMPRSVRFLRGLKGGYTNNTCDASEKGFKTKFSIVDVKIDY